MNVRRFVARSAREALGQARATWGDNAVVLSNREVPGGVEIMAMAHVEASRLARISASGAGAALGTSHNTASPGEVERAERADKAAQGGARRSPPVLPEEPLSTVSFEHFVRERQRQQAQAEPAMYPVPLPPPAPVEPGRFAAEELQRASAAGADLGDPADASPAPRRLGATLPAPAKRAEVAAPTLAKALVPPTAPADEGATQMLSELRSLRETLGAQLAGMNWFEQTRRQPVHTRMLRLLLEGGLSPGLARHLVDRLSPAHDDATARRWVTQVLQRNLDCASAPDDSPALRGGAFALVGPAGAGKTNACARLARAHAAAYGAASVGLVALEPWPGCTGEPLRGLGRGIGLPVHTVRDAESLADLLALLSGRGLVLVDTPGVSAHDPRLKSLAKALPASLTPWLVLPASAQAEALEAAVVAWSAALPGGDGPASPVRCVFTRMDETRRSGALVDLALRRKLRIEAVLAGPQDSAGGVKAAPPESAPEQGASLEALWPRPDAAALAEQALAPRPSPATDTAAFALRDEDLGLLMTGSTPAC